MPIRQSGHHPILFSCSAERAGLVWHADQMGVSPCCRPTFPVPQRGTACYNSTCVQPSGSGEDDPHARAMRNLRRSHAS